VAIDLLAGLGQKEEEEQFKSSVNLLSDLKPAQQVTPSSLPSYIANIKSEPVDLLAGISQPSTFIPTRKQTVAEFRKDPQVQKDASIFLAALGKDKNADFVEILRDEDFSLTTAMNRSFNVGSWNDEEKQAYLRLRNKFDNAELKSFGEKIKFAKDAAVDIIADPFNIAAALFAIPTLGQSFTTRAALGTVAQQGLKKLTASEARKEGAKRLGIYGAAEGAGWGGAYDYFSQSTDIGLDLQDDIDWGRVGQSSGIGAVVGGGIGGVAGAISGPMYLKKLYKHSNEDDIIKQAQKGTRTEVVEDEVLDIKTKDLKVGRNPAELFLDTFVSKPTRELRKFVKGANTLLELLPKFRYDWDFSISGQAPKGIRGTSYGEAVGRRQGEYIFRLQKGLNMLERVGFSARLSSKESKQLVEKLANPKITKDSDGLVISDYVNEAAENMRVLLNDIFKEGNEVGIFSNYQKVKNYFPRKFEYSKVEKDRNGLERLLIRYGLADPIDDKKIAKRKLAETGETVDVLESDLTIDQQSFPNALQIKDRQGNVVQEFDSFKSLARTRLSSEATEQQVENVAKELKAEAIVDQMLEYKFTPFEYRGRGQVGHGFGFMKHRAFDKIPEAELLPYLNTNPQEVLQDYVIAASQAIERTRFFGKTVAEFETNYVQKIKQELRDSGMPNADVEIVLDKVRKLHQKVTGIDKNSDILQSPMLRNLSEWGRLSQQMAHLPLATLSSITEPFILLSRVGVQDVPQTVATIGNSLVSETKKVLDKTVAGIQRGIFRKSTRGLKGLDDEAWNEIYQTGLALEQAVLDRIEGLTGEALTGKVAKSVQNAFFKVNLLTPWTSSVQLASFTTAKRIIRQNAEKLFKDAEGIAKIRAKKKQYYIGQLNELGLDEKEAIAWYRSSLKDGKFRQDIASASNFYNKKMLPAANRFVKEVILNPSTAEANRPLWYSSPAGQLLAQFAGYPTVFNNTILRRFINESKNYPLIAGGKVLGTSLLMTSVAVLGNAIRSEGRSLEGETGDIIVDGVRRWGGLGAMDYASRFQDNLETGGGQLGTVVKTFTGPLAADVVDSVLYRKGIAQTAATNIPFYSLLPKEVRDELKRSSREIDSQIVDSLLSEEEDVIPRYATGGLVKGPKIPNVKEDPADTINKLTGEPYSGKSSAELQMEELFKE
tara:strand:- start:280 stop:3780 length:3501 start_codon:yes stop_codon:yes gene_type:complete